jgi:xanthine dehydrogenase large subunit
MTLSGIHGDIRKSKHHDSAAKHVSGRAVYVDDMATPANCLTVLIGQSAHAHAKITHIDLSAVAAAPGIVAVMTAADIPGVNDCGPAMHDDPVFAVDEVCYVGQSVFAIAAIDMAAARAAIGLAVIDYDPLPAILSIDAAMEAGSLLASPSEMIKGDTQSALATAPHQLRGRLCAGGQEHFYLEGQAALAFP